MRIYCICFAVVAMQGLAKNPDRALRGHLQAQHLPHQSGLPAAGTAYQRKNFSTLHAKINIFMHHMAAEAGIQPFDLDNAVSFVISYCLTLIQHWKKRWQKSHR